jgi:hypothetical protein
MTNMEGTLQHNSPRQLDIIPSTWHLQHQKNNKKSIKICEFPHIFYLVQWYGVTSVCLVNFHRKQIWFIRHVRPIVLQTLQDGKSETKAPSVINRGMCQTEKCQKTLVLSHCRYQNMNKHPSLVQENGTGSTPCNCVLIKNNNVE